MTTPAPSGEGRRPTLTWPRQIPIDGEPADVAKIVAASAEWLSTSRVPKLFFRAEPGAILANEEDLAFIRSFPSLTEVKIAGRHFVQEDSPDEIGQAIASWMEADPRQKPMKHSSAESKASLAHH